MAVNQALGDEALWDKLMKLDNEQRRELAELLLSTIDDGDDLSDEERERLHAALARSREDFKAGRFRSAADVMADLRARARP